MKRKVAEQTPKLTQTTEELLSAHTRQQQLETDRNRLLLRLASIHEEERARLSRELHDQIGQQLTGISLGLYTFQLQITNASLIEQLRRLSALVQ